MKCNACLRQFGPGETILKFGEDLACNKECAASIDARRPQQDALPDWQEYVYQEAGFEAGATIRSATLGTTKVRDIDGESHDIPVVDIKLQLPADDVSMAQIQQLHRPPQFCRVKLFTSHLERA